MAHRVGENSTTTAGLSCSIGANTVSLSIKWNSRFMFRGHNKIYILRDSQGGMLTLWGALRTKACRFPHSSCWGTNKHYGQSRQPYWKCDFLSFLSLLQSWVHPEWVHEVAPPRWSLSNQRTLGMYLTITPLSSWFWVLNPKLFLWPLTRSMAIEKWPLAPTRYLLQATSHSYSQSPSQPESLQL